MAKRLVIMCMDKRMNTIEDEKYNDGKTLFMRSAGATVTGVFESIHKVLTADPEISEIDIVAHTDCKAMLSVMNIVKNGTHMEAEQIIEKAFVGGFRDKEFSTLEDLESKNPGIQAEYLRAFLASEKNGLSNRNIAIKSDIVDLSKAQIPHFDGKPAVLVVEPGAEKCASLCEKAGVELSGTYIIQESIHTGNGIHEVEPDVVLIASVANPSAVKIIADHDPLCEREAELLRKSMVSSIKSTTPPDVQVVQ